MTQSLLFSLQVTQVHLAMELQERMVQQVPRVLLVLEVCKEDVETLVRQVIVSIASRHTTHTNIKIGL